MKVEYIVGSFLAETEIATHIIPETPVVHLIGNDSIKYTSDKTAHMTRKTENTTKGKFKVTENQ